jgi:hypothetical protein
MALQFGKYVISAKAKESAMIKKKILVTERVRSIAGGVRT